MNMPNSRLVRTTSSALWAAYGDSLGFITELTNESGLKHRTGQSVVTTTIPWKRKIGGKFGPTIDLPAGTYSDDTQLRLCTSRSIMGNGDFDVETFAKIEIPVWNGYALGAGRGCKAAALSLSKSEVTWYSNFFQSSNGSMYLMGGGNGAAMRIQPHVWCSKDLSKLDYIADVVKNSICTHGHPRGILGAVFHAQCLAYSLNTCKVSEPEQWSLFTNNLRAVEDIIKSDEALNIFWLPRWEKEVGKSIRHAIIDVIEEFNIDIEKFRENIYENNNTPEQNYHHFLNEIGAFEDSQRGSAVKTSLLAAAATVIFRNVEPETALAAIANELNSDTDTIATMTGALIGSVYESYPSAEIQDREYIINESERLYNISCAVAQPSFRYPDLYGWKAPKSMLEIVGLVDNQLAIAGLSKYDELSQPISGPGKNTSQWQWVRLSFGQTTLVKRREDVAKLDKGNYPVSQEISGSQSTSPTNLEIKFDIDSDIDNTETSDNVTISDITDIVIKSGFNDEVIGYHLKSIARKKGVEGAIAFSAIISKAIISRDKKKLG